MTRSMASETEKGSGEIWINMAKYSEMLLKDESDLWFSHIYVNLLLQELLSANTHSGNRQTGLRENVGTKVSSIIDSPIKQPVGDNVNSCFFSSHMRFRTGSIQPGCQNDASNIWRRYHRYVELGIRRGQHAGDCEL